MNFLAHMQTITHHKKLVMEYCFAVGLYKQGILHDLSKFSPTELLVGAKYFQGNRSPNNAEREDKGYSSAWLHHKGRNKHHFEYWIDYNPKRDPLLIGMEMPVKYVVEMFVDRIAACQTYQKEAYTDASPWEYHKKSPLVKEVMHPNTVLLIEKLLHMLANEGEEKTLIYARKLLQEERKKKWKKKFFKR